MTKRIMNKDVPVQEILYVVRCKTDNVSCGTHLHSTKQKQP